MIQDTRPSRHVAEIPRGPSFFLVLTCQRPPATLLGLGIHARSQCQAWQDPESFQAHMRAAPSHWRDTIRKGPRKARTTRHSTTSCRLPAWKVPQDQGGWVQDRNSGMARDSTVSSFPSENPSKPVRVAGNSPRVVHVTFPYNFFSLSSTEHFSSSPRTFAVTPLQSSSICRFTTSSFQVHPASTPPTGIYLPTHWPAITSSFSILGVFGLHASLLFRPLN